MADAPDIRESVDESRGLLKKLQLIVPGFRGYRQLEDLRAADELLRRQVAGQLKRGENRIMDARSAIAFRGDYGHLQAVASLLSKLQLLEGDIMHAEQGYTGISPSIRMDQSKISSLYDFDYAFISSAAKFASDADSLSLPSLAGNDLLQAISRLSAEIDEIREKWSARMAAVQNIEVV
ncbi:MAG: hypothetical protein KIY12_06625 [Thermoplasmata archaeon]|uniref:Uncharacterized protein n=1 Tax=Candidatus Sysuiplasma superficiale TaxID=2823368 RepID=A0A8J7YXT8_9ARCH|nr:hypothetical protein [Candidatus Sysuiplasma superficiale]MCL4346637.1 hypothetical protein [Candidatus Thermoplasmatota archaeon]